MCALRCCRWPCPGPWATPLRAVLDTPTYTVDRLPGASSQRVVAYASSCRPRTIAQQDPRTCMIHHRLFGIVSTWPGLPAFQTEARKHALLLRTQPLHSAQTATFFIGRCQAPALSPQLNQPNPISTPAYPTTTRQRTQPRRNTPLFLSFFLSSALAAAVVQRFPSSTYTGHVTTPRQHLLLLPCSEYSFHR